MPANSLAGAVTIWNKPIIGLAALPKKRKKRFKIKTKKEID
jgi:hypothetical protein